jgi:hypothetical protein
MLTKFELKIQLVHEEIKKKILIFRTKEKNLIRV